MACLVTDGYPGGYLPSFFFRELETHTRIRHLLVGTRTTCGYLRPSSLKIQTFSSLNSVKLLSIRSVTAQQVGLGPTGQAGTELLGSRSVPAWRVGPRLSFSAGPDLLN
jgi:hypothetical protein